jgi:hypothetical protein
MAAMPLASRSPGPRLFAAACALALAGCGGGFFFSVGDGFDGDPPSVSLAAPDTAAAGQTIRLTAAAADDVGVERVTFHRVDGANVVQLGADFQSPYQIDVAIPAGAGGVIEFFASATDVEGHVTHSAPVVVTIVP